MRMRPGAALAAVLLPLAVVPCLAHARTEQAPAGAVLHVSQVKLTGKAAKPRGEATGTGAVIVCVDRAAGSISFGFASLFVRDRPTAGHVHRGAAGASGPVVFTFSRPGMVDPLVGEVQWAGVGKASKSTVAALLARPGGYYVDVHTPGRPKGAVRGQLGPWKRVRAEDPAANVCQRI